MLSCHWSCSTAWTKSSCVQPYLPWGCPFSTTVSLQRTRCGGRGRCGGGGRGGHEGGEASDVAPAVPLPPPAALAGDPAATADEVGEEADDIFGAGFYDDIDEEHHDDTDGERTDEEFEVLEYMYTDGVYGGEREYCGSPDEVKAIVEEVAKDAALIGLEPGAVEESRPEDTSAPGEPISSSGGHEAPHPGDELPDPVESGRIYFEGRAVLRLVMGEA